MTKNFGAKIGFAVTSFALVICVIAFFLLDKSFAWFAKNDAVSGRGISISVKDAEVKAQLLVLGVLTIENDLYTFDTAVDASTGERIQQTALPVDDPNGISYSKYSKALVVELSLTVAAPRATKVHLVANSTEYDLTATNDFSTCIKVSNATLKDADTLQKTAGSTKPFVDMETMEKSGSLLLYDGTLSVAQGGEKLYFIIEYNDEFLDYINAHILATSPGFFQVNYYHDVTLVIS